MTQHTVEPFNIVGISIRTTNANGASGQDILKLWNQFITNKLGEKITNKVNNSIYCIYTDYEGDYTKPYTVILGYKVKSLENVPNGLVAKNFSGGIFNKYLAVGDMYGGSVFNKWQEIWNLDIKRAYTYDYEVYSEKAQISPQDAEVEIHIAVK